MATLGEALQHARQLFNSGQFPQAESVYRQLLAAVPQAAELWQELAMLQVKSGRPDAAVESLQKAVQLEQRTAAYHSNLGAVYRLLKRTDDAIASFRLAVECSAPSAELWNNLALALKDAGRADEALVAFDEALRLRPDYANGHFNRANLLLDVGRLDEAVAHYHRTLVLNPNDAGAHCKLGVAYYDLGEMDLALTAFDRALEIQPDYPEVRRNRSLVWLARGEYARGWPEFEWRLDSEGFARPHYSQPRWDGTPLAGRTLLVHAEQGLGDTLQFIRYVPLIEQSAGVVRVEVQAALLPLLKLSGFGQGVVEPGAVRDFDVYSPLMSLPRYLPDGNVEPFWQQSYLTAERDRIAHWAARLDGLDGFKVGIAWSGNPGHAHDQFRSVRLESFAPLAKVPGVRLVSLQKGSGREQLAERGTSFDLVDFGDELDAAGGAFMDTAAVIANLDLVITVDTAIAHLAGGMGAKVWVALHRSPDWRWLTSGDTTAWYPSMRLFRQRQFDDWPPVFQEIADSLKRAVSGERT